MEVAGKAVMFQRSLLNPSRKEYVSESMKRKISKNPFQREFSTTRNITNSDNFTSSNLLSSLPISLWPTEKLEAVLGSQLSRHTENKTKARFRRRSFHEPNLIQIWTDPN